MDVKEANARLPLVRAVVKDAMERWRELGRVSAELASLREGPAPAGGGARKAPKRREELEREKDRIEEELEGYVSEISQLGAQIKDFEMGLVDFPSKVGSRMVLLCWKAGEPRIQYWHEVDAGFAGRRPLEDLA